ncbi:MAG: DUF429 domain-containing protein [Phycisphaerales bacterium]
MRRVLGVDGCKGGWLVCALSEDGRVGFLVLPDLASVFRAKPGVSLILADVPIGLPGSGVRACDMRAKGLLGRYNSRVFLMPARAVFEATDYPAANTVSRSVSGKGLSKQAWHIMPKIKEVDGVLQGDAAMRSVVRECHPEICFWGLCGAVIAENKKTDEGAAARLGVLGGFVDDVEGVVAGALARWPRKVLARDDVIDALVCAVTAAGVWDGSLRTIPEKPERDGFGLAMEMVYRDGQAIVRR